ncbi:MAG: serine kinase [Sulfitobacter sp.]|nr:serine kinase [Sulfitobacter sp.]
MEKATILHATTVSVDGKAVMILGPSGAGKSALGLRLISLGGQLVADDRTEVRREGVAVIATAPKAISGLIEARGVGILRSPSAGPTPLHLVVDLSKEEAKRLPDPHFHIVEGREFPCLHRIDGDHFAAAILLYMRGGITSGA